MRMEGSEGFLIPMALTTGVVVIVVAIAVVLIVLIVAVSMRGLMPQNYPAGAISGGAPMA